MVTIVGRVKDQRCFLCGSSERAVEVKFKDRSFIGTLCMEHLYDRLQEKPDGKSKAEEN